MVILETVVVDYQCYQIHFIIILHLIVQQQCDHPKRLLLPIKIINHITFMTSLLTVFGVPLSIFSLEGLIRSLLVSSFFFQIQICGSHSIFQKNYSLCDAFVKKIASFYKNQEYFWKHAKTVSFYSKWEISFLFSFNVVLTSLDCILNISFSRFHDIADFCFVETKETRREGNNCQYSTKEKTRDSFPFGFRQCTLM